MTASAPLCTQRPAPTERLMVIKEHAEGSMFCQPGCNKTRARPGPCGKHFTCCAMEYRYNTVRFWDEPSHLFSFAHLGGQVRREGDVLHGGEHVLVGAVVADAQHELRGGARLGRRRQDRLHHAALADALQVPGRQCQANGRLLHKSCTNGEQVQARTSCASAAHAKEHWQQVTRRQKSAAIFTTPCLTEHDQDMTCIVSQNVTEESVSTMMEGAPGA